MCGGVIFEDPVVKRIAQETKRTPAQVILRWHIQKGHRVFPKSVHRERIRSNFELFDFALDERQVESIDKLGSRNEKIGPNPDIFFEVFE